MHNIQSSLDWAKSYLQENNIEDAHLSSQVLLQFILQKEKTYLIAHPEEKVSEKDFQKYQSAIKQRSGNMPVAYITGEKEFYGMSFYVNESVLIPRPETELLVEKVFELYQKHSITTLIDMGTGSGILPVCLKAKIPSLKITAVDISPQALEIAQKNAQKYDVDITLIESNLFEKIDQVYDIVVSNPPYVTSSKIKDLGKDVQKEPKVALDGGDKGMQIIEKLIDQAHDYIDEKGYLVLEIGFDQKDQTVDALTKRGYSDIEVSKDYQNLERVVVAKR